MTECIVIGRNAKAAEGGLRFVSLITFFIKLCVRSLLGSGCRYGNTSEVEVKKETVGCGKRMGCISNYPLVFS